MQQFGNTWAGPESRFIFKLSTQELRRGGKKGIAMRHASSTRAIPLPEEAVRHERRALAADSHVKQPALF
jgi:hypothetical protein